MVEKLRQCVQHEVGVRNLEVLNNTTDAKGRKLEVFKVHVPPPLFRKYKEAEGVHVSPCPHPDFAVLTRLCLLQPDHINSA